MEQTASFPICPPCPCEAAWLPVFERFSSAGLRMMVLVQAMLAGVGVGEEGEGHAIV